MLSLDSSCDHPYSGPATTCEEESGRVWNIRDLKQALPVEQACFAAWVSIPHSIPNKPVSLYISKLQMIKSSATHITSFQSPAFQICLPYLDISTALGRSLTFGPAFPFATNLAFVTVLAIGSTQYSMSQPSSWQYTQPDLWQGSRGKMTHSGLYNVCDKLSNNLWNWTWCSEFRWFVNHFRFALTAVKPLRNALKI